MRKNMVNDLPIQENANYFATQHRKADDMLSNLGRTMYIAGSRKSGIKRDYNCCMRDYSSGLSATIEPEINATPRSTRAKHAAIDERQA